MASHLGLRCLTMSHLWDARLKWVISIVLRTAKTLRSFGRSEFNRVKAVYKRINGKLEM